MLWRRCENEMRSAVQSCDPLLLKFAENQGTCNKTQVLFSCMVVSENAVMGMTADKIKNRSEEIAAD